MPFTPQQLYVDWSIPYMVHYPEFTDLSLPADSPEFLIDNNIGLEWGITLTKLITAPDEAEFDQVLADFLARRDELGYAQMMEARNALVQKNKAKLDPYR